MLTIDQQKNPKSRVKHHKKQKHHHKLKQKQKQNQNQNHQLQKILKI